jgi:glutathione S-transferase
MSVEPQAHLLFCDVNNLTDQNQINRHIIPSFYRVLQEQDPQKQVTHTRDLKDEISKLVNASHVHGPFFLGPSISFVDIQIAPWILRLGRVLTPYRGWPAPEVDSRWATWVNALEENEHVMATTSTDELYLDSYQRYAGK